MAAEGGGSAGPGLHAGVARAPWRARWSLELLLREADWTAKVEIGGAVRRWRADSNGGDARRGQRRSCGFGCGVELLWWWRLMIGGIDN